MSVARVFKWYTFFLLVVLALLSFLEDLDGKKKGQAIPTQL